MRKILKSIYKNIYKCHLFLDRQETFKFLLLLLLVSVPSIFLSLGYIIVFLISMTLVCAFTLVRVFGPIMSKRSLYNVPEVGDIIVVRKPFDSGVDNRMEQVYGVERGTEWIVSYENWEPNTGDWNLYLKPLNSSHPYLYSDRIVISYFKSRKYWKTKVDIRNDKLKKLGVN